MSTPKQHFETHALRKRRTCNWSPFDNKLVGWKQNKKHLIILIFVGDGVHRMQNDMVLLGAFLVPKCTWQLDGYFVPAIYVLCFDAN